MSFEATIDSLREIVDKLEKGSLPLETALKLFEEGVGFARHGHTLLQSAERRVDILLEQSGQLLFERAEAFDDNGEDEDAYED